ncbi:TPA: hypothetical protein QB278_002124 [Pasteurella multocida]|nr:hypothetical protein [Pasteurella multocida]
MQQIAKNDVTEKLKHFQNVAEIADKLDSSEVYKTAFNSLLKAEAIKLADKGFTIELEDYQNQTQLTIENYAKGIEKKNQIPISNPSEEAKEDLAKFLNYQSKDFELLEKMSRSNEYATSIKSLIPLEQQNNFFSKINQGSNSIIDKETEKTKFNKEHSALFPIFSIDPIAIKDLDNYSKNQNDLYMAFEIVEKMKKKDYEKSVIAYYEEMAGSLRLSKENFSNNKINNLNDIVSQLTEEQKKEFTNIFNEKYPNGFKTTLELEKEKIEAEKIKIKEIEAEAFKRQDEFNAQLHDYLKTEYGNEEARIKQTQYLQEMMIKEPQNFERLSQNFFTQNDLSNTLPNENLLKLNNLKLLTGDLKATPNGAVKLTENLKQKVLNSTKQLALTAKAGSEAVKSKEHLKMFYADKFNKEYIQVEKKFQMKRQLTQKNKVDSQRLSH